MGRVIKAVVFGGRARVTAIEITDAVQTAIEKHGLSPLAAAALGRSMAAGAYIGANLKNARDTYSMTVNGTGGLGKIVVAGDGEGHLRGFVGNPNFDAPIRETDGKIDVRRGVGTEGEIIVIKDLGLKENYIGRTELVSGEIGEDFAYYLYKSEGVKSAVALGVKVNKNGCVAAGGLIAEAMPDCTEEEIFVTEDIMSQMTDVSAKLEEKGAAEIINFYFGHLDAEIFPEERMDWKCSCSEQRIENVLRSIGKKEADSIIEEAGKIEIKCEFCNKIYTYDAEAVNKIFGSKPKKELE